MCRSTKIHTARPGVPLLTYPAVIPVSTAALTHLSGLLRTAHRERGVRWRRLEAGEQAQLVLAHRRNGDTYQRLAAGFGIGVATVYCCLREAINQARRRRAESDPGGTRRVHDDYGDE